MTFGNGSLEHSEKLILARVGPKINESMLVWRPPYPLKGEYISLNLKGLYLELTRCTPPLGGRGDAKRAIATKQLTQDQEAGVNKATGFAILIPGGAGFIGSNLVDTLLTDPRIARVRVLDNLSTGFQENIAHHFDNPQFEFMEGDIRDFDSCLAACQDMDIISHHAALGSVPRSIADPLATNAVNITGMLNILQAAKESGIKRVVYAASSSTYGDSSKLPKVEHEIGKPLSPYAVTKYVNELYASVYHRTYGLEVIGLRYFNVFGPRQSPQGAYAAAIPLFINLLMKGTAPTINGDGSNSRDFTFVANAVQANLLALFTQNKAAIGEVFNIAYGKQTSLLELCKTLCSLMGTNFDPIFGPEREGDIKHSLADIGKARAGLGYDPKVGIREGLVETLAWHLEAKLVSKRGEGLYSTF